MSSAAVSRAAAARVALFFAAGALVATAAGCKKARTETVVVVQTAGVRIPDDVAQIRVVVADRAPAGDDVLFNDTVALCTPTLRSGCYDLPLSAVLFPGPKRGVSDSVRVEIDALASDGRTVTADAALFTFAEGQSQRLDFVLYQNCIGVIDCAKRDQACGPDAHCVSLATSTLGGSPDLGNVTPVDMAKAPVDMAGQAPVDMAMPPRDMAGCTVGQCIGRTVCIAGSCQTCGTIDGDPCCDTGALCDPPFACQAGTCHIPPDMAVACGALNEPCCTAGPMPASPTGGRGVQPNAGGTGGPGCGPGLTCSSNMCVPCGAPGLLCCVGQIPECASGATCQVDGTCPIMMPSDGGIMMPPG
jgi:hypothetical protein